MFVPTKIEGLTLPLPTSGDVSFKLPGDLIIRNVTKQVTWDVRGTVNGGEAKGTATTSFTWDYFGLSRSSQRARTCQRLHPPLASPAVALHHKQLARNE